MAQAAIQVVPMNVLSPKNFCDKNVGTARPAEQQPRVSRGNVSSFVGWTVLAVSF